MTRTATPEEINRRFREAMDAGAEPSIRSMTEDQLHAEVTRLCEQRGIRWVHIDTPYRNKSRDLIGFPDLQLFGTAGIAFRELKSQHGKMRPEQTDWRYRLLAAGQDWAVWRPSDLASGAIAAELDRLCTRASAQPPSGGCGGGI